MLPRGPWGALPVTWWLPWRQPAVSLRQQRPCDSQALGLLTWPGTTGSRVGGAVPASLRGGGSAWMCSPVWRAVVRKCWPPRRGPQNQTRWFPPEHGKPSPSAPTRSRLHRHFPEPGWGQTVPVEVAGTGGRPTDAVSLVSKAQLSQALEELGGQKQRADMVSAWAARRGPRGRGRGSGFGAFDPGPPLTYHSQGPGQRQHGAWKLSPGPPETGWLPCGREGTVTRSLPEVMTVPRGPVSS